MIYVMGIEPSGVVKIGTAVNPQSRLRQIQAGYPYPLRLLLSLPGDRDAEAYLHQCFAGRRVSAREWFDFSDGDAVTAVSDAMAVRDAEPQAEPEGEYEPEVASDDTYRIAVAGAKGGTGATHLAVLIAHCLADAGAVTLHDVTSSQSARRWFDAAAKEGDPWTKDIRVIDPRRETTSRRPFEVYDLGRFCDIDPCALPDGLYDAFIVTTLPNRMDLWCATEAMERVPFTSRDDVVVISHIGQGREGREAEEHARRYLADRGIRTTTRSVPLSEWRAHEFGGSIESLGVYRDIVEEVRL